MPQNNKAPTKKSNNARLPAKSGSKSTASKPRSSSSSSSSAKKPSSSAKGRSSAKPANDRAGDPSRIRHQLAPSLLVLAAIFLVVCYLAPTLTGFIGNGLRSLMFGLFAKAAWAIPLLLVNTAIFWKRDLLHGALRYKPVFSTLVLVNLSVIIHAATRKAETFSLPTLWRDGIDSVGGGAVGGFIGNLLLRGFGVAGTLILTIALILLFGIFLFGMTPQMFASYLIAGIREWRIGLRENMEANRLEREQLQIELDQRRIAERKAQLRLREQQLREQQQAAREQQRQAMRAQSRPQPQKRRINDAMVEDFEVGTDVYDETPLEAPVETPVEVDEPEVATPEPIDPAIFDEIVAKENERYNRRSEELAEPAVEDGEDEIEPAPTEPAPLESTPAEPKLSFFKKEKVRPLPKTETQKLEELEEELDLSKIFAETPVTSEFTPPALPDDDEESDIQTSAEIDLVIEKSALNPAPMPEPIDPDDEDEEDDEPPFDMSEGIVKKPSTPANTAAQAAQFAPPAEYIFPPKPLLAYDNSPPSSDMSGEIQQTAVKLVETLRSFNVKTKIINVSRGPTVTRYELQPEVGTKVKSITNLVDDIALHLATSGVRIEAPIPGKEAVGIEVPNKKTSTVFIRELIEDDAFESAASKVTACLGMDIGGNPVYLDVAKMPHLLIAGTTGSGKSVCINSLIISILYKARPDEVKFILIDPKKVELNPYNGIPHLLVPVVSDPKKAAGSLHWAVTEMERRYELIEGAGVRNLKGYNQSIANDPTAEKLPLIVIVIDELADLMMMARDDVEESICRIAQKARAAGIHLIIGTQRPDTNVITGLIKANVPSRIAFTTTNQIDSRVILDTVGAEKLIGRGDMLYSPIGAMKPTRVQGSFVSDDEVEAVTEFIKNNCASRDYDMDVMETIEREAQLCGNKKNTSFGDGDEEDNEGDPMLKPAIQLAVESGKISTSLIQRRLQLGYGRAAKLIDMMEQRGIVGPPQGSKPRDVLISMSDFMEMETRG